MLNQIIRNLENELTKSGSIKNVEKPKILIKALKELRDDVIGMDAAKESIASATIGLIRRSSQGYHTLIAGPPGVGKTKLAIIWATIIYSIGVLDKKPLHFFPFGDMDSQTFLFSCLTALSAFQYMIKLKDQFSFKFILGGLILLGVAFYVFITFITDAKQDIDDESVEGRDIISVVSREDFVGQYVGQSAPKTKALLEKNIGKVLFIDEAYSLISEGISGVDFGNEVLSTLNLFMSEHADKIVVVFAGYADKIKDSIISAQPGFERRITYTFNCESYTLSELWLIFLKHFETSKHKICFEDQENIYEKIIQPNFNENAFDKGQAGDMVKLRNFAIERMMSRVSKKSLNGDFNDYLTDIKVDDIRYDDVERAMESFNSNKLKDTGVKRNRFLF
jgi:SpoVK/Ycf46/Vps4 family AAA+-type ATPase